VALRNEHLPSEVLGGFLLGAAALAPTLRAAGRTERGEGPEGAEGETQTLSRVAAPPTPRGSAAPILRGEREQDGGSERVPSPSGRRRAAKPAD
jgi:hypothetical protein